MDLKQTLLWDCSRLPPPEEAEGSNSQEGPFPSQAIQSAHASASGASGCERSPGEKEAGGQAVLGQGTPTTHTHPGQQGGPVTSERSPTGLGKASLLCSRCTPFPSQLAQRS